MKTIWFRAKRYGYGWTPCTWQGWLCIAVYTAVLACLTYIVDWSNPTPHSVLYIFVPGVLIATAVLVFVAWKKGEPARWRWGDDT